MPRKQCNKCPWKVSTNPHEIPNGYSVDKHRELESTVASGPSSLWCPELRIMACHDSPVGREVPCVGWLVNQMGPGNNLGLRLAVLSGQIDGDVEIDGPQHASLEDTLPSEEWFVDDSGQVRWLADLEPDTILVDRESFGFPAVHIGRRMADGFDIDDTFVLHQGDPDTVLEDLS